MVMEVPLGGVDVGEVEEVDVGREVETAEETIGGTEEEEQGEGGGVVCGEESEAEG